MARRELLSVATDSVAGDFYQMRRELGAEELDELTRSVQADGVLVPLLVQREGDGFRVVAGHRRLEAARRAGLAEVPVQVIDGEEVSGWGCAFAENMFRANLSAVEEAAGIADWMSESGEDVDAVGRRLHRGRAWVESRLELLKWPPDVLAVVHEGKLSVAAARPLARITDDGHRRMLVDYAVDGGASARVTGAWAQAWEVGKNAQEAAQAEPLPGREGLPAIEPYTPCGVCGEKLRMVEMRYLPLCPSCQDQMVRASREARESGGGLGGSGVGV